VQTVLFDKPVYDREMLDEWFRIVNMVLADSAKDA